jgi:hypothetical protein
MRAISENLVDGSFLLSFCSRFMGGDAVDPKHQVTISVDDIFLILSLPLPSKKTTKQNKQGDYLIPRCEGIAT